MSQILSIQVNLDFSTFFLFIFKWLFWSQPFLCGHIQFKVCCDSLVRKTSLRHCLSLRPTDDGPIPVALVTHENFKSLQDSHFPCLGGQTVMTQEKRETSGEAEKSGHFLVNWPDPHPAWAQCFGLWYAWWPRMKGNSKRGLKSLWQVLIPGGTEKAGGVLSCFTQPFRTLS